MRFRAAPALLAGFLGAAWTALPAGEPANAPAQMRLVRMDFLGLRRCPLAVARGETGLQLAGEVGLSEIRAAAGRLMSSGFFSKIGTKYTIKADMIEVVFETEEAPWSARVVFDNFVWFTDTELTAAVAASLPGFDGTAPRSGRAVPIIAAALGRLAGVKGLPEAVEHTVEGIEERRRETTHVFSLRDVKLPICSVSFTGSRVVDAEDLQRAAKPLLGAEYSRRYLTAFAEGNLLPRYRQRGFLRASFGDPHPGIEPSGKCDGVSVRFDVVEGFAYTWAGVEWSGGRLFSAEALTAHIPLKNGDLADGVRLSASLREIEDEYRRRGYVDVEIEPHPRFQDDTRAVTCVYTVNEGSQYRMGELNVKGLPPPDAERIRSKWPLARGAVYDALVLDGFMDEIREGRKSTGKADYNEKDRIADVTIVFD